MSLDRTLAHRSWKWAITLAIGALLLCIASPSLAANRNTCPTDEDRAVLSSFGDRVAAAQTAGEAQEIAMSKLRVGRVALSRARAIIPGDPAALGEAEERFDALEAAVLAGTTPAEVAAPFQRLASIEGKRCHYSTVEIVVVVFGFVFGIIPGVIFLLLFC